MVKTLIGRSALAVGLLAHAALSVAQVPIKIGTKPPDAYFQRLRDDPKAFSFSHSFLALVQKIQANRARVLNAAEPRFALAVANLQGGVVVSGTKTIPVATALYSDAPTVPYDKSILEKEFFTGPWPTGTMTQFYSEISYGNLTVNGVVLDWQALSNPGSYYAGDDYQDLNGQTQHCLGLCSTARIGEMISELIRKNPGVDWGQFDNDGPDRRPNSGDDDGYVDFIVIVHPGIGGECDVPNNTAIWSHRGQLPKDDNSYLTNTPSAKSGFGNVRVSDYVIVPALACDGVTPNPIGVASHEFGHAFGLPDLYDTTYATNGGVGDWDLMATGAWGGDDNSPQSPTQMSAWAKAFLGWVNPIPATQNIQDIALDPIEKKPMAYQISGPGSKYVLISNRQKSGFDSHLPESGLLVEIIDPTALQRGWSNNQVNINPSALAVQVLEADGGTGLVAALSSAAADRQDATDVFPISSTSVSLDANSTPKSPGAFALCNIRRDGETIRAQLLIKQRSCPAAQAMAVPPVVQGLKPAPARSTQGSAATNDTTVNAVVNSPEKFLGKPISLSGRIENTGTNFFTDLRLALTDLTGKSISMQLKAPTEVPPTPPGKVPPGPPSGPVSTFLNKQVVVTGSVVRKEIPGQGTAYVFQVTNVQSK
jgi:M6 family metalloprotease-like protein